MKEEVLMMVDAISNEKNIEKDTVFSALEEALATATRKKLKYEKEVFVKVTMDRKDASYETHLVEAIDEKDLLPTDPEEEAIHVEDLPADRVKHTQLENVSFDRVCIQTAKQIIYQKIRQAENEYLYQDMKARIGKIIKGTVKYMRNNGCVVYDINNAHFFLPNTELVGGERLRTGSSVQAVLSDVSYENNRNRFTLSRRSDSMLSELMYLEIPEISEGTIQIKGIARNPGVRAKVIVKSNDKRIDCVGACVGIRGMRAQMISDALGGERIDIIPWSDELARLVMSVLAPVEVQSIDVDEESRYIYASVKEEFYAQTIGKEGINVRMANKLLGWQLNILTEEEVAKKATSKQSQALSALAQSLGIDLATAKKLAAAGINSLEEMAYLEDEQVIAQLSADITDLEELMSKAQEVLLLSSLQQHEQE